MERNHPAYCEKLKLSLNIAKLMNLCITKEFFIQNNTYNPSNAYTISILEIFIKKILY